MRLHSFPTSQVGLTIDIILRTSRQGINFDVMDSNGLEMVSEPFSNLLDAISHAQRQVDLIKADQKNIVTLGAIYPRPTMYEGASIWMESQVDDIVLLNGTHICIMVEGAEGLEAITTSDILTKGYGGRIVGTIDGKEMAAVSFQTRKILVKLEVLLDARLTDGDLTAVGFISTMSNKKPSKYRREF